MKAYKIWKCLDDFWDDTRTAFYKLDKIYQIIQNAKADINYEDNSARYIDKIEEILKCNHI